MSELLEPARRLRAILAGDSCVVAASIFDPVSARLATRLEYPVGVLGGSVASHTILGAPDLILITADELICQVRRICRATSTPLIVDADHGYGNALNVLRTVEELQAAGAAGITIEDTLLPRSHGSSAKPQLLSLAEGVGKIKGAVLGRRGGPAVVFGRTSAAALTGIDDAVARFDAYQDAGADALFIPGLKTEAELEAIARRARLPIVVGGSAESLFRPEWLHDCGVRVWLWGHQPYAVAVQALHDAMAAVKAGRRPGEIVDPAHEALLRAVTDVARYQALTQDLLEPPDDR